ncbi:MAG: ATP-binding cassette domain-containing protein, partial [Persicimonas sp.]
MMVDTMTESESEPEDEHSQGAPEEGADGSDERRNLLVPNLERWPIDSGEPILKLVDVSKSFGDEVVLEDLSLEIAPGEITVIMGTSGSGKSVLIKLMNGLLMPDEGQVLLFGDDTRQMSDLELDRQRKRIGTLFQNYALFDSMSAVENVAFPLVESQAMRSREAEARAADILEELGLGEALDALPGSLSGGMKKRVSLARALIANPEVVLFDEPTTGLDPIMMEFVDDMILEITESWQLTSVIISHDIASTMRLADSVAILHEGRIIAHDRPEAVRELEHPAVQELFGEASRTSISAESASSIDFDESVEKAVVVDDVYKSFGDNEVLKGISFTALKEKITVLIGGSGSGKSV